MPTPPPTSTLPPTFTLPPTLLSLAGYRATGKSVVAAALALQVDYEVVDTDKIVTEMAGKSIADIFAEDGESVFRDLETSAINQVVARSSVIVALGGGAVLREQNRKLLKEAGPVVLLTAPVEVIRARMAADAATRTQRPRLKDVGSLAEVEVVLAERAAIYAAVADMQIETEVESPAQIAERIRQAYFLTRD